MAQLDLATAVTRQLAAWGVRTVFAVPGDNILPLLDAMAREGNPVVIEAAHESGAGFMASGWAKLQGELGVCLAAAPGVINLLQGLAEAAFDGAPVLALTGQVETAKIGTNAKQYFRQQNVLSNFAAYSEIVMDAAAALRLLISAMAQALWHRTVSHLSIPKNLWTQPVEVSPGAMPSLVASSAVPASVLGDLDRASAAMQNARRPLMVLGGKAAGAQQEARQLAASWGAAVVVAQEAKGIVPDAWPQVIGGIGEAWAPEMLQDADCMLLIGTASFERGFWPQAPVIQLETHPWLVNEVYLWDSLVGGIKDILTVLARRLAGHRPDQAWLARVQTAKQQRMETIEADLRNGDKPIHPARLMAVLGRAAAKDAIIALDEGAFNHWFDRDFLADRQRILLSSQWRSMGAGLPAAIAAKLRHGERQVIAVTGDGGLLMSLGELVTAVRYRLALTVIVVSNRGYGLEKDKALLGGLENIDLSIPPVDFRKCAEAFGLRGFRVEDPEILEETLREAFGTPGPSLVDVVCADVRLPEAGA